MLAGAPQDFDSLLAVPLVACGRTGAGTRAELKSWVGLAQHGSAAFADGAKQQTHQGAGPGAGYPQVRCTDETALARPDSVGAVAAMVDA